MFDRPDTPEISELPPLVEEIDLEARKKYTKDIAKRRQGRASTVLSSLGSTNTGKKTVLG
jgi:hypothetical protein